MTLTTILAALLSLYPRSPARSASTPDARPSSPRSTLPTARTPTCLSGFSPRSAGTESHLGCARASGGCWELAARRIAPPHRGLPTDAARRSRHAFAGLRLDGRRHRPIPRWARAAPVATGPTSPAWQHSPRACPADRQLLPSTGLLFHDDWYRPRCKTFRRINGLRRIVAMNQRASRRQSRRAVAVSIPARHRAGGRCGGARGPDTGLGRADTRLRGQTPCVAKPAVMCSLRPWSAEQMVKGVSIRGSRRP